LKGGSASRVKGELLAANADTVWVLAKDGVVSASMALVVSASVKRHEQGAKTGLLWGAAVGLGSGLGLTAACSSVEGADCGGILAGSALSGAVIGGLSALSLESSSRWRYKPVVADSLLRFARFPQGMPDGAVEVLGGSRPVR